MTKYRVWVSGSSATNHSTGLAFTLCGSPRPSVVAIAADTCALLPMSVTWCRQQTKGFRMQGQLMLRRTEGKMTNKVEQRFPQILAWARVYSCTKC